MSDINFSVPSSPDLEGSEHVTLSAHVSERTLAGSAGSRATDSGNSSHSSSSSPGLCGVLLAGLVVDGVSLSSVLGHVGVHEVNDVLSDGGREDSGQGEGTSNFVVVSVDGDDGSSGHGNY